ncbi:cation-translocating P-type ATPase [Gillisia limnaea]|uniref:ATPase, P-type (Transporting), HAD superfamily, subfamily IC n=1 Tax=Gillisia limnaea (strain DSM 15749 / LMG 21470 / R-8282) TaxID=865937 RepID=H2BUH1_GILLR|nr:cation-translocating P-type ATPase [Gillisia limnaea]EHQ03849.1 ATPase, P-type (transporting), HAD superfamily, subfamily IC [Gillisia limnaea DSM 15749]
MKKENPFSFKGLSAEEVKVSRLKHGENSTKDRDSGYFLIAIKEIVLEPMFVLLVVTSTIYFILQEYTEGFFLLGAIILISAISFFQNARSRKALSALKEYTQSLTSVIRDNKITKVKSEEIVVGDMAVISEGEMITADGIVLQLNDFLVNESILTGESFSVTKGIAANEDCNVYQGTSVISGQCVFRVARVGRNTKLGVIDASLGDIHNIKSPLQKQISRFVKQMALWGVFIFLLIWGLSYYNSRDLLESLLKGLTISMSVLPEEIPVAFTTFMALGAYRLMKLGIIVRHTQTIETLGSATVLCTDKTGTITQNKMDLYKLYDHTTKKISDKKQWGSPESRKIISIGMWASESVPFDPMEKSLHAAYLKYAGKDERSLYKMIHEYPLGGKPPMMTHIFENHSGDRKIAVKGAPEAVIAHSNLNQDEIDEILKEVSNFASQGLRVLGVGEAHFAGNNFPETQEQFDFEFLGLLGFYDPPKKNIKNTLDTLYEAGIKIKIITGDNTLTTLAIAKQVGFRNEAGVITGEELMKLSNADFDEKVLNTSIFTRVFPEVKLKIVHSLKNQNQIVGMTGDGVNDAPALKAAHIGIAMGKRGSDIAKNSSSLILSDDDFGKMVDAVAMGRKIYFNLKKAIQYIISIHIPIILTVALPLVLGWIYPVIFTPVHVIFLELIMGPTCSIIYENEPLEKDGLKKPPRSIEITFLRWRELSRSVLQGLIITAGCLLIYQFSIQNSYGETLTRTMVFSSLIFANIFLTLVNRSFYFSMWSTFRNKNPLIWIIIAVSFVLLLVIIYQPAVASLFKVTPLNFYQFIITVGVGFASVIWFEIYKWVIRLRILK